MKYYIAFVVLGLACAVFATSVARVEEKIWKNLEESETTNIKISFRKSNTKSAFDRFNSLKLTTREAKLNTYHAILKEHADIVQADVAAMLNKARSYGKNHELFQLWITNELIVRNVDKEVVEILRDHPDVASLEAEWFIQLEDDLEEEYAAPRSNNTILIQWGVERVGAPDVWATGINGQGAVVGVTDTGARATHVALRYTYRGNSPGENHNYNWFAPTGQAAVPSDTNGHGTHVIGSASGTEGIGVAPGSRWITCRGCATAACSNFDLLGCGQWMTCPTTTSNTAPDCSRAPNVVNNSWGGGGNNPWYDAVINGWRAVGIVPIFSAGNSGPGCSTLLSPGDRPGAIGIASIAANNQRSGFSSNGPTVDGRRNPLVAAPGTSIPSASHLDDVNLRTLSGTSMSAPHATGVVALIFQRNPQISVEGVTDALARGAIPHAATGVTCGGIGDATFPNNHVGYGRLWAPYAVAAA
ncbi:Bacillopeptidase F [Pseudolycoriella hygida]|uniref:Bacillopeptidase F n=1 Tax=Pseudolycoriella hygida TaxID=35572 RepID=A0A9Q0S5G0_9DIPT|nr:Bacillopeptidase F [Pseudolycoriella hygida]